MHVNKLLNSSILLTTDLVFHIFQIQWFLRWFLSWLHISEHALCHPGIVHPSVLNFLGSSLYTAVWILKCTVYSDSSSVLVWPCFALYLGRVYLTVIPKKQAKDSLEVLPSHSFQSALKKLIQALLNGFPNGQICGELNNLRANEWFQEKRSF